MKMKRRCAIRSNCKVPKGYDLDNCASPASYIVHVECEAKVVHLLFGKARVRALKKIQSIRDIASVVMLPKRRYDFNFEPKKGNMMVLTHDQHIVHLYGA